MSKKKKGFRHTERIIRKQGFADAAGRSKTRRHVKNRGNTAMVNVIQEERLILQPLFRSGMNGMCDKKDKPSFDEVYKSEYRYIRDYIYSKVRNFDTAEDITSDVFLKALTHYESFDPQKASVHTWMCHIANNTVVDFFRKKENKILKLDLDEIRDNGSDDDYPIFMEAERTMIQNLMTKLTPEEKEIVILSYFHNMKSGDLGEKLGITAKAACERRRRAVAKMSRMAKRYRL